MTDPRGPISLGVSDNIAVFHLVDGVSTAVVSRILGAVDTLHAYLVVLTALRGVNSWPLAPSTTQLSMADWLIRPGTDLYTHIASYPAFLEARGRGTRLVRAHINSPGFITIEGGEALSRIVDILHKGGLEKEQIAAITRRVNAETALLEEQVIEKRLANLQATVSLMQQAGLSDLQIRSWLRSEARLPDLLGAPLTVLQNEQVAGTIVAVTKDEPASF